VSNVIDFNKAKERIGTTQTREVHQWSEDQIWTEIENISDECDSEFTTFLELNKQLLESVTYMETLNIYLGGLIMSHGNKTGDYGAWTDFWKVKEAEMNQLELDFNGDDE